MFVLIVLIGVLGAIPAGATMPPPPIRLGGTWEMASSPCEPPMPAWVAVMGC